MAEKIESTNNPRKITLKAIGATPDFETLLKAPGKKMDLCEVWGVATVARPGASDLGPYCKFLGQFRAKNLLTGELFESAVAILPKFLEEQLFGAMGSQTLGVEFAFRIAAKYDKEAATKYVYEARSLIPAKESEQLLALEARLKDSRKMLEKKAA